MTRRTSQLHRINERLNAEIKADPFAYALATETRRERKARIKALADADWNALAHNPHPVLHARQHLAEMDPAKRASLMAEWDAQL